MALFTLLGLIATGGAVASQSPAMLPIVMQSADARLFAPALVLRVPVKETPPLLEGCHPPRAGSVCLPGDLTSPPAPAPPGPYDLVPETVRSVEDWRPLVAMFFAGEDVDRALRVLGCESRGRPGAKNLSSTASGLFQHLASQWPGRADKAGWGGSDVFDPVANVAVAAWLVYEGGGWSHWNASAGCW
jgi:hypothetical protein